MKNLPSTIASILALFGGFLLVFAITLANDNEAVPSAVLAAVCFVMSIWISHWYENRKLK